MKAKFFIAIPLIATLAACGGGSGRGGASLGSEGTLSVLVTDNLAQDYAEVWVTVRSITATDANGQVVTLYEDTAGQTHNLSQLVNIGALVDTRNITTGTYNRFEIVLDNAVTLVDQNGVVTNARFDQSGNPTFSTSITGTLTVDANQAATLALDFDLQQFTYDAGTNTVTPVIVQKDPTSLDQTVSTVFGEVESITDGTRFVLDPAGDGRNLTVVLHNNATVTNTASGEVLSDTRGLSVNMKVSVSGTYDTATLTITAATVQIENGAVGVRHKLEGTIMAINGSSLTIDIHEASFMPGANTLIVDVSNATFSHGRLDQLAVGQKVDIKGAWDGNSFTPAVVEIEGYSRNSGADLRSYNDEYAEINGRITEVNGDRLTVTVREREHASGIKVGDSVTIDSTASWIERGDAGCLMVDAIIEAKGPLPDATTMIANNIEIENGCGRRDDSDDDDDNDGADEPLS